MIITTSFLHLLLLRFNCYTFVHVSSLQLLLYFAKTITPHETLHSPSSSLPPIQQPLTYLLTSLSSTYPPSSYLPIHHPLPPISIPKQYKTCIPQRQERAVHTVQLFGFICGDLCRIVVNILIFVCIALFIGYI